MLGLRVGSVAHRGQRAAAGRVRRTQCGEIGDGVDAGKINLWTTDHYHASDRGYYLEALVIFGHLTGRDPRSLGENECSGFELGLSRAEVKALQQVAFDELAAANAAAASPLVLPKPVTPERCPRGR